MASPKISDFSPSPPLGREDDPFDMGYIPQGYQNQAEGAYRQSRNMSYPIMGAGSTASGWGNNIMGAYQQNVQPLYGKLNELSNVSTESLLGPQAIDIGASYDKARGIAERQLSRMGVNPNSGRFAGMEQKFALARAAAEAGAKTRASRDAQDDTFRRTLSALQVGQNMPNQALGANSQAIGAYGQASNIQDRYGRNMERQARESAYDERLIKSIQPYQGEPPQRQQAVPVDTGITPQNQLPPPAPGMEWTKDPTSGRNVQVSASPLQRKQAVNMEAPEGDSRTGNMALATPPKGMKWEQRSSNGKPKLVKMTEQDLELEKNEKDFLSNSGTENDEAMNFFS